MMIDPTERAYADFATAYRFFNERLFAGTLPPCLITMQRKNKAYGYFAGTRFGSRIDGATTDEIALNPTHFRERTVEQTLSTLVHEMVHLRQQHFGKPSRTGYHNGEWAKMMREAGLIASDTGQPGGKETGQRVSHYIEPGGRFETVCAELTAGNGPLVSYVELWSEADGATRRKKAASKTKYACEACGVNAWAKPATNLVCGDCMEPMQPEEQGG